MPMAIQGRKHQVRPIAARRSGQYFFDWFGPCSPHWGGRWGEDSVVEPAVSLGGEWPGLQGRWLITSFAPGALGLAPQLPAIFTEEEAKSREMGNQELRRLQQ